MIYLIGGASRSGKTYLAKKLLTELKIPIFELDYLKMGLARGLPEYGVNPLDDEKTVGKLLWPIVIEIINTMVENEDSYIIEGTYLLPEYSICLSEKYDILIRSCFLGYPNAEANEKLHEIRKYGGIPGDPLRGYSDEEALTEIKHFIKFSQFLLSECNKLNLHFIDVTDREAAVESCIKYLCS
ncbi:MAG: hypothetical protein PVI26_10235 [Chitinispirillia bacterium]|jgi:2-phosphoglycerate kinase